MRIRNLDAAGDWTLGKGRQDYLTGDRAIALNVATRLREFLGDCFWSLASGVDWWNLLGSKNPAAEVGIVLGTRAVLAGSEGVVRINSVDASTDVRTRKLSVSYNVDTIYSRTLRNAVTITP